MERIKALRFGGFLWALAACFWLLAGHAAETYSFVRMWPEFAQLCYFDEPHGVAVDASGNMYVADYWNDRVQKLTSDGVWIREWAKLGRPDGVAVDASGNVYVAGGVTDCIAKFTPEGVLMTKWGGEGTGDGLFKFPQGVAVGPGGNVYVVDVNNHRIQKFTPDGVFITKWGSKGIAEGEFDAPCDVAVDGSGNVYVTEWGNSRIQKFTSDGVFITKWGKRGYGDGEFLSAAGVAVDGSGNVYVASCFSHRVQKFTSDGAFIAKWGSDGSGDGQFRRPTGVAVDSSGNVYVAEFINNRVQKFTSEGVFITKWGSLGSRQGEFYRPEGIAVDGSGNVYVADTNNNRIQKFTSDGVFITKWESYATGLAVDGSGNVYVTGGNRVKKFTSDGVFITELESGGTAVAVDGSGNVYVTGSDRVRKFTSDGVFIAEWGSYGHGEGEFSQARGVAVDSSGNVYVADYMNYRIQKFTSDGVFITEWGSRGGGDGEFSNPYGVAVDGSGNVYVADSWSNHRIQKFTSDGVFITKWGSRAFDYGNGEGEFYRPYGVAVDASGSVYVADTWNHRIQKFRPFKIVAVSLNAVQQTLSLVWHSAPGQRYVMWHSADLAEWSPLGTAIQSEGETTTCTDSHTTGSRKFYRVALPSLPDTAPPVIRLLGDNPTSLEVGSEYIEPGFTAADNVDGDITTNVVVTGEVVHTVLGAYTLHYNVSDSSANPAVEKTRTVNVVDNSASPEGMRHVPGGSFQMGDNYGEGITDDGPVHAVEIGAFYIDKYHVTKALWDEVYSWAVANGYSFDNPGSGKGADHPVHTLNWYDAVKWCNARSEKEGLTPVYYTSSAMTIVYRSGQLDLSDDCVRWGANGYRLPTEAEWEKAARGGLTAHHFPWESKGGSYTDHIDGSKANYSNSGDPYESGDEPWTTPVGYYDGNQTPPDVDMANGYGLYDMAGNVYDWCWDWYQKDWYSQPGAKENDTRGPDTGTHRVGRGGSWLNSDATSSLLYLRCAGRDYGRPSVVVQVLGFRCVRSF